ncbi:MAG: BACON domain-containing protein [Bryobacterales bacterium]|nr:BACON domain-containing protein [Bryobacterales bacterium]
MTCCQRLLTCALLALTLPLGAETLSNNLTKTSAGAETATGNTWLTSSFRTGSSGYVLDSVTLLLANPTAGQATLSLYSDKGLKPGELIGTLTAPVTFTTAPSNTVFSGNSLAIAANTTYWIVLKAATGSFSWSWTADNTGEGSGFQNTWGSTTDAGSAWQTYAAYPLQFLTSATPSGGSSCTYSLSLPGGAGSASAATGSFTVTTASSCTWSAVSNASWITVTSGNTGTGSGTVNFSVQANTTTADRTGTITVGNQVFTVVQYGAVACSYSLSSTGFTFPAAATTAIFSVNTSAATCPWTTSSNASWLTVTTTSGTGSGFINYSVAANTGTASRTGVIAVGGQSFTITQTGAVVTPLRFVPVTPCRVSDTRYATGAFGGPRFAAGETRSIVIPSSPCNVPATAQAYSLNLTVVPPAPLSYVTLFPTGTTQPLVSTLNSWDGRTKANTAIVPAGTNGAVSVYVTHPTDVILDINGYFVPATTANALAFYPVTPCRIIDTRNSTALSASATRTVSVTGSTCAIPATAQAYALNVTAVPQTPLAYVTIWPTGTTQPFVSTLNAPTGTVTANAALVPAGANGSVDIFATNTTHAVIDINGYFAPAGTGGLSFYTATPCRSADTRSTATLATGATRTFPIADTCGIPSTARAYSLNATVVPPAALSYLTLWPTGSTQPLTSTLNSWDGATAANAAIIPAGTGGVISAYASNTTDLILDVNGYFAP